MLNPESPLGRLLTAPMRPGVLCWIGLRPARRAAMVAVEQAELDVATGVVGDRYEGQSGKRQVTLLQQEHLAAVGSYLGSAAPEPALVRRNLVVAGLNLLALGDGELWVGEVRLQVTGPCHPCSRMEEAFGTGGYNAVRGHGGLTARVVQGGRIRLGDVVRRG